MLGKHKGLKGLTILLLCLLLLGNTNAISYGAGKMNWPSPELNNTIIEAAYNSIGEQYGRQLLKGFWVGNHEICLWGVEYQTIISREQFCDLLLPFYEKVLDIDMSAMEIPNNFIDIQWQSDYSVNKLRHLGIVSGTLDSTFDGKRPISRQEAAVILVRFLKAIGVNTTGSSFNSFCDDKQISSWARESINFCYNNGFMEKAGDNIEPLGKLSYEQAIVFIYKAGIKYNLLDRLPTYTEKDTINISSLPTVSKESLANYYNPQMKRYIRDIEDIPDNIYVLDNWDKAVVLQEGIKCDEPTVLVASYDELIEDGFERNSRNWCKLYGVGREKQKGIIYNVWCDPENDIIYIDRTGEMAYGGPMSYYSFLDDEFILLKNGEYRMYYMGWDGYSKHFPRSCSYVGNGVYREELKCHCRYNVIGLPEQEIDFSCEDVEKIILTTRNNQCILIDNINKYNQ